MLFLIDFWQVVYCECSLSLVLADFGQITSICVAAWSVIILLSSSYNAESFCSSSISSLITFDLLQISLERWLDSELLLDGH